MMAFLRLLLMPCALALSGCGPAETPVVNAGNLADETVIDTQEQSESAENAQAPAPQDRP